MRIDGGDLPLFLFASVATKSRVTQALLSNFNMDEFVVGKPGMFGRSGSGCLPSGNDKNSSHF